MVWRKRERDERERYHRKLEQEAVGREDGGAGDTRPRRARQFLPFPSDGW